MGNPRSSSQALEKWIGNYHFMGRRQMAEEEKSFLLNRLSKFSNPWLLVFVGFLNLITIALVLGGAFASSNGYWYPPFLFLTVTTAAAIPSIICESRTRYREDMRDIRLGEVELFETGTASPRFHRMVFLPRSQRILSVQGRYLHKLPRRPANLIAPPQPPVTSAFPRQFCYERGRIRSVRTLTPEECQELGGISRFTRPPLLALCLLLGLGTGFQLAILNELPETELLGVIPVAVLGLYLMTHYALQLRKAALVSKDVERGIVFCECVGNFEFEHLGSSDLVWTVDRLPAPWRKRVAPMFG